MAETLALTDEQKKLAIAHCPASAEGTIRNAERNDKVSLGTLTVGVIAGAGIGGLVSRTPFGVFGGGVMGAVLTKTASRYSSRKEGEKLAASGVKQVDSECVRKAEEVFHQLNATIKAAGETIASANASIDAAKANAEKIGKPASAASAVR